MIEETRATPGIWLGKGRKNEDNTRHVADITAIMQVRRRRGQTDRDKMEKHKRRPDDKSWT